MPSLGIISLRPTAEGGLRLIRLQEENAGGPVLYPSILDLMLWRISTRRFVLRRNQCSATGKPPNFNLPPCRYLATTWPEEETLAEGFPLSERISWYRHRNVPPPRGGISLQYTPQGSVSRGVTITKRGLLIVVDRLDARKECPTALILSAASTTLTKVDFTRLLPESDRAEGGGLEGSYLSP